MDTGDAVNLDYAEMNLSVDTGRSGGAFGGTVVVVAGYIGNAFDSVEEYAVKLAEIVEGVGEKGSDAAVGADVGADAGELMVLQQCVDEA